MLFVLLFSNHSIYKTIFNLRKDIENIDKENFYMSRDLTPCEHLAFEKENVKNGGLDIFSFMKGLTHQYNGKDLGRVYSDEEITLRKEYGTIGKLMGHEFLRFHDEISKIVGGEKLLKLCNEFLENHIETGVGSKNSPVIKWFYGEFDKDFYCSGRNDKLFAEWFLENIKTKDIFI